MSLDHIRHIQSAIPADWIDLTSPLRDFNPRTLRVAVARHGRALCLEAAAASSTNQLWQVNGVHHARIELRDRNGVPLTALTPFPSTLDLSSGAPYYVHGHLRSQAGIWHLLGPELIDPRRIGRISALPDLAVPPSEIQLWAEQTYATLSELKTTTGPQQHPAIFNLDRAQVLDLFGRTFRPASLEHAHEARAQLSKLLTTLMLTYKVSQARAQTPRHAAIRPQIVLSASDLVTRHGEPLNASQTTALTHAVRHLKASAHSTSLFLGDAYSGKTQIAALMSVAVLHARYGVVLHAPPYRRRRWVQLIQAAAPDLPKTGSINSLPDGLYFDRPPPSAPRPPLLEIYDHQVPSPPPVAPHQIFLTHQPVSPDDLICPDGELFGSYFRTPTPAAGFSDIRLTQDKLRALINRATEYSLLNGRTLSLLVPPSSRDSELFGHVKGLLDELPLKNLPVSLHSDVSIQGQPAACDLAVINPTPADFGFVSLVHAAASHRFHSSTLHLLHTVPSESADAQFYLRHLLPHLHPQSKLPGSYQLPNPFFVEALNAVASRSTFDGTPAAT